MKKYLPQFSNEYSELFDVQVVSAQWLGGQVVRWRDDIPGKVGLRFWQARALLALAFYAVGNVLVG